MKKSRKKSFRPALMVVEAALLFPILLLLTFGVMEYGWLFIKQQQITNTARQAARQAATAFATQGQVDTTVGSLMSGYGLSGSGYSYTHNPGNAATAAKGSLVSVTISIPYANIDITGFRMLPMPDRISASVSMEKEGP